MSNSEPRPQLNLSRSSLSALQLSFVFLLVVLIANGAYQWLQQQQRFHTEVNQTLNNFAQQSQLLAQASFRTNVLLARSHQDLITKAISADQASQEQFWGELQVSIFNLTGASIFSAQGELKLFYGELFNETEAEDIWRNILALDLPQQVFAMRYENQGGFYVYNSFYGSDGNLYYLVVRRSYSELSQIIYDGGFSGFELLLLDTQSDRVFIREQFFANTNDQPQLTSAESERLIDRVHLPHTSWDIAALPISSPLYLTLWQLLWQPSLVLSTFLIIAGLFAWRAQVNRNQALALKRAEEETQQRAKESDEHYKALFDEASVGHCLFDISQLQSQDRITLVRVNDAALTMAQASSHEQFSQNFQDLVQGSDNPFSYYLKRALTLKLSSTEFELSITTFNQEPRTLWATISISSYSDTQILASFIDVTAQKLSIQQTREREVFWGKVMDAMPDLVYVVAIEPNNRLNVLYNNRTMGSLLGYQNNDEEGNDWFGHWVNHLEGEASPKMLKAIQDIKQLAMGQTREITGRFRHANGGIRLIKFRDTPMLINEHGVVSRYIGTVRDVTDEIERQEQILESERRYRLLAENINDVIWATDSNLNLNFVSSSVKHLLGYQADAMLRSGIEEVFRPRDMKIFSHYMAELLAQNNQAPNQNAKQATLVRDMVAYHKNGHELLLEVQASPLFNDTGRPQGVVGICRDVGAARRLQSELHLAAEVFNKSNEGIIITGRNKRIVKTNAAIHTLTGFSEYDLYGKKPSFLVAESQYDQEFINNIDRVLEEQGYWQGEISYQRSNGETRTAWAGVSAVQDDSQFDQSLIIILSDITERKHAEEQIRRLAYFDTLTGLANRSQLNDRLSLMMNKASTYNQAVALLFIDLDRFKPINDSMGHPAGDAVLQEVANRLRSCVKKNDFICRMGGDEFTLAIDAQPKKDVLLNARNVAERILEVLNEPFVLGKHEAFLSGSIGIAIYPEDATSVIDLIKRADMAMYHAKESGRNNVQFFDHSMSEQALDQLILENDMRHALERDQLELYYQPQYQAESGRAIAVEALLRWHHPERGMLPPSIFIPIIEDTGMIGPIGQWVLNQACQQFAAWKKQGLQLERIAVNVSARQFKLTDFVNIVLQAIEDSGIRTYELELEITESILIDDVEHTINTLKALQKIGVRTAIDDFGTGYSSLNYLKQFPVDTLKIDRSFVQGLPNDSGDAQIAHTIIAMAHNLGMGVIAEGVESQDQLDFLVGAKCEEVQGFFFSQPMPADRCSHHLEKHFNRHNEESSSST